MLSLFRKSAPVPDPSAALAILVQEPEPEQKWDERVQLSQADQVAADLYLSSKPLASEYEKKTEYAKKQLLASLGLASSGVLPDGRVVSKHVVPVPAESAPRKAHNRTSITIQ